VACFKVEISVQYTYLMILKLLG